MKEQSMFSMNAVALLTLSFKVENDSASRRLSEKNLLGRYSPRESDYI